MLIVDSCKRLIFDAKKLKIDTLFTSQQICVGEDYETDKFLITVDSKIEPGISSATPASSVNGSSGNQSLTRQVPAFSNRLAGSKSRKGFNPPKRVIATTVSKEEESVQKQNAQTLNSGESGVTPNLSLFSSYSHPPVYTASDNHQEASRMENIIANRSERDILSLITSATFGAPTASHNDFTTANYRRLPGEVSTVVSEEALIIETAQPLTSIAMGVQDVARAEDAHVVGDNGSVLDSDQYESGTPVLQDKTSLWTNFLSQESSAESNQTSAHFANVVMDISTETSRASSKGSTVVKQPTSVDNECAKDLINGRGSPGLLQAQFLQRKPVESPNICNPSSNKTINKITPECLPSNESPQMSIFSLGSLPSITITDEELSDPDVCSPGNRLPAKFELVSQLNSAFDNYNAASLKRSTDLHSGPALFDKSEQSVGHNDDERLLDRNSTTPVRVSSQADHKFNGDGDGRYCASSISYTSSSFAVSPVENQLEYINTRKSPIGTPESALPTFHDSVIPQRRNAILDLIRCSKDEDLQNNTSLFELDDSVQLTPNISRETSCDPVSNVWSLFTSPQQAVPEMKAKSIFDSPELNKIQPYENKSSDSSTDMGLYRSTKLAQPSLPACASVFGSMLPHPKIEQARSKVLHYIQQDDTHLAGATNQTHVESTHHLRTSATPQPSHTELVYANKLVVDSWTLRFPPYTPELEKPMRNMVMPISFKSTVDYKQTLEQVLREYINIILLDLCKRYHDSLGCVDISGVGFISSSSSSFKSSGLAPLQNSGSDLGNPKCQHGMCSKVVEVKKEGPNKGRLFYTCSRSRGDQCKFFEWTDKPGSLSTGTKANGSSMLKLSSVQAMEAYLKSKSVHFYCSSRLNRTSEVFTAKRWSARNDTACSQSLYLKLARREKTSTYTKGDLWAVSQSLSFDLSGNTFIAKSVFYGPNSENELELSPIAGYSSCNWPDGTGCYAIHTANVSTELICLANLQDLSARTVPVLPWLIHPNGTGRTGGRFEVPSTSNSRSNLILPKDIVVDLAGTLIERYNLNEGQAEALMSVAGMFTSLATKPICLIKGVFGAGKSFLLSIVVQFLTTVLDIVDQDDDSSLADCAQSKILIASMTNVAVDRILLSLLEQGFSGFLRVGSLKKIAKPILPYSLHASGSSNSELRELQEMLKDEEINSTEKTYVKKCIGLQKIGINKQKLGRIRVVGVTCAACSFPILDNLKFKIVLLDECSQMTEPVSLLPIKRATCSRLVLVGDPRQLKPTIQSSDSAHNRGLEQTMFDRLSLMGAPTCHLQTQYRCHPAISALCRDLFYDGLLHDGITAAHRPPLCSDVPAVCLYNIQGTQKYSDSSFYNEKEATFVCRLVSWLIRKGVENHQIGVITLYKAQVLKINAALAQEKGLKRVQVATVDSFQGGERDIIILSSVRTDQMGFVDDVRRANVALSRGKHHLLIVAHTENLRRNKLWRKVVSYCEGRVDGILDGNAQMKKWEQETAKSVKRKSLNTSMRSNSSKQPKRLPSNIHSSPNSLNPSPNASIESSSSSVHQPPGYHHETMTRDNSRADLMVPLHSLDESFPMDFSDDEFLTQYQRIKDTPVTPDYASHSG